MGSFARVKLGQPAEETRRALEAVSLSATPDSVSLIEQLRQAVPFRHIIVSGLSIAGTDGGGRAYLLSDFPPDYMAEYHAGDFADSDPLVAMFRAGQIVCRDSEAFSTPEARRKGHEVLDLLRRHGIAERTVISIAPGTVHRGAVSLISDKPLSDSQCSLMQLVAPTLHAQIAKPATTLLNKALKLTRGELYCLERAARGMTSEDIALEKTYSVDTVNTYLKTATRKLGAQNRVQAVAEAMRRGLIG